MSADLSLDTEINLKTYPYLVSHPTILFITFKELGVINGSSYAFREPKEGGESLPKPSGRGGKDPQHPGSAPPAGQNRKHARLPPSLQIDKCCYSHETSQLQHDSPPLLALRW